MNDWRTVLAARWRASESGPFFEIVEPPTEFVQALPADYLAAVAEFGGREGFLGDSFLRLYRIQELVALNLAYDVAELFPEVVVVGSNGCGEAYAFTVAESAVVQVPFIPLSAEHAERRGPASPSSCRR